MILYMFAAAIALMLCVVAMEFWLKGRSQSGILTRWFDGFRNLWHYLTGGTAAVQEGEAYDSQIASTAKDKDNLSSLCTSPNCIRCSRKLDLLVTALTRLSYYIAESKDKNAKLPPGENPAQKEYHSLVADVKKSLERAKSRDADAGVEGLQASTEQGQQSSPAPVVLHVSGLREQELWPMAEFQALSALRSAWKNIALEFVHLYKSPFSETRKLWRTNTTVNGRWDIAQLVDQGRTTKAADFCPITANLLKQIPDFLSGCYFGDASFSVVHPGTSIITHCGSSNSRIRCHLGLQIPQDVCTLVVGEKSFHWEEGEILCFDDSYPHSVHHRGGEDSGFRAVFMIDLWHPDVSPARREMIRYAFSP